MFNRVARGAGFALLVGAAIVGCNSGSKTEAIGGFSSGDLTNPSDVPASSISTLNLAPDGGGFSMNGQNFTTLACKFNTISVVSSSAGTPDGTAMILFTTNDGTFERLWGAYWDGSSMTVPTEITGDDRDETAAGAARGGVTVGNILMCPLNTSRYKDATGAAVAAVQANAGNWAIVWDAITARQAPSNVNVGKIGSATGAEVESARGPHRTLYYTLFVKALKGSSSAFSQILGFGAGGTGTPTTSSREYRYGFLAKGIEIPALSATGAFVTGGSRLATADQTGNAVAPTRFARPADDVISYGMATDTTLGCAQYNATDGALAPAEPRPIVTGPAGAALKTATVLGTNSETAAATFGTARPSGATYDVGDDTSFLRIFYVQLTTSHTGDSFTSAGTVGGSAAAQGGQRYRLLSTGFNLAKLEFAAPAEVTAPTQRANGTLKVGTQPLPNLRSYNGQLFWRYLDSSLAQESGNTSLAGGQALDVGKTLAFTGGGANGAAVPNTCISQILAITTVASAGDGTSSVVTTQDVTFLGAVAGGVLKHAISVPTTVGIGTNTDPLLAGPSNLSTSPVDEHLDFKKLGAQDGKCSIFGADEGLGETVGFCLQQSNSLLAAGGTTEEVRVVSFGVNPATGAHLAGSPAVLSTHAATTKVGSAASPVSVAGDQRLDQLVVDSVNTVECRMSRDGTYVLVAFDQLGGSSLSATITLRAVAYKTNRTSTSSALFATSFSTPANLNANTSHALTARGDVGQIGLASVSQAGGTGAGARTFFTNTGGAWFQAFGQFGNDFQGGALFGKGLMTAVPLRKFAFQGNLGYACGIQSDVTKMNVFWDIRDNTDQQVFVGQVTTLTTATPPTATAGTEAEIDVTSAVQGPGVPNLTNDAIGIGRAPIKSTFRFVPTTFDLATDLVSTDGGADSAGKGGGAFVAFVKVTDATVTDGDFFDRQVKSQLWDGTTVGSAVILSRGVKESNTTAAVCAFASTTTPNPPTAFPDGAHSNASWKTGAPRLITVSNNSDFTNKASYSADAVYVLFNAPAGDSNLTSRALWTRTWDQTVRRTTATATTTFDKQFIPNFAYPTAATTPDKTLEPTRLDRDLGSDALINETWQDGKTAVVAFTQDKHIWAAITADGKTWSQDSNGRPAPGLLDNNTSGNAIEKATCRKLTTNCDDLHGSFVGFTKPDYDGDTRLFFRVWQ